MAVIERIRRPVNVLVHLYRVGGGGREFAVFRRTDDGAWQGISGGVEGDETTEVAALREVAEETGLREFARSSKLSMVSKVDKSIYAAAPTWPDDLYLVDKVFFAFEVPLDAPEISLSSEHGEYLWLGYSDAYGALRYEDEKTALLELNARIERAHFES